MHWIGNYYFCNKSGYDRKIMNTKEKILQDAYIVFINNGFHNTSMQQLVEASKLSKGAFYHYFKSKNELYKQVVNQYFLSFYTAVNWNDYQNEQLTIKDVTTAIERFYLNFVPKIISTTDSGMSKYYIMYFEAYNLLPEFKTIVQDFYENLKNILKKATDNTEELDKKATEIIAKYEGLLFLLAINPDLKIEMLLKQISE